MVEERVDLRLKGMKIISEISEDNLPCPVFVVTIETMIVTNFPHCSPCNCPCITFLLL
jgi:hypothetical protein